MSDENSRITDYILVKVPSLFCAFALTACSPIGNNGSSSMPEEASAAVPTLDEVVTNNPFAQVMASEPDFAVAAVQAGYRAILQRDGDEGGVQGHSETIQREGIKAWVADIRSYVSSDEFKQNIRRSQANRDILNAIYLGFLNRPLDSDAAKGYLELMAKEKIEDVAVLIGTSDEFFNKIFSYSNLNEDRFIKASMKIARGLLGRDLTSAETDYVKKEFAWNGNKGLYSLIETILKTDEFQKQNLEDQLVTRMWQNCLGRGPTSAEKKTALDHIKNGHTQRAFFEVASTPEFFTKL